jgi:2-polyprenyl-6-methoxyphenol hydroxylase-like FAD-dependent oxidoreductase
MTPTDARTHAVVLGAGIAGLLTARVLSDSFEQVTVVERDRLPRTPVQRKGIPQGHHLHGLLSRGSHTFEELCPGVLGDLAAAGAEVIADGDLSRVYTRIGKYGVNRSEKFRDPEALRIYAASRPFLEFYLRRRVAAANNVTIVDGHDAGELIAPTPERVTGVRVVDRDSLGERVLDADLVIDATGRNARIPALLDHLGYGRPEERRGTMHAIYASAFLRIAGELHERLLMVPPEVDHPGGALAAYEDDTWVLTAGQLGDDWAPPADFTELISVAGQFMPEHIASALRSAQPLSEVVTFRYRGGFWRRYDLMARFPAGLLVIGDAVCSLNPIYGQGMTVAAMQVVALRDYLRWTQLDTPQRFFRTAAEQIGPVWAMNQARDRAASPAHRNKSMAERLTNWTLGQAVKAAESDIVLTERFFRVNHLIDPPNRLQDPVLLGRILRANLLRWRRTSGRF